MDARETDPADPGDPFIDAVMTASRALMSVAARSLGDAAEEVMLAQYRALVVLASRGPQRLAALADRLGVAPPTATRMCDRLVRKGLVHRRHKRYDRRSVRLTLTAKGRGLVGAVTERRRAEITPLVDAIPVAKRRELIDSLQRISAAAGEVPEQDWSAGWDLSLDPATP